MSENLLGPFVRMTLAMALSVLVMGMAGSVWWSAAHVNDPPSGFDIIGEWEYEMASNLPDGWGNSQSLWNVTSEDNTTDKSTYALSEVMLSKDLGNGWYMESEDNKVYVAVIRNNSLYDEGSSDLDEKYNDFFFIWDAYKTWGGLFTEYYRVYIPFSEVIAAREGNLSIVQFTTATNYSLFIQTPNDGDNFTWDLYANNYYVAVGQIYTIGDEGSTSMWTVLYWILFFDLPDTNIILDVILGLIFWLPMLFIAVTFLSRYIPLIGGG